jgi:hypothetical protein
LCSENRLFVRYIIFRVHGSKAVYWYFWNHKSRTLRSRTWFSKTVRLFICELAAYSFRYAANWSVATLWGEGTPYVLSNDATSFGSSYRAATSWWYGQSRQWHIIVGDDKRAWTG